jgi:hypothetical protein
MVEILQSQIAADRSGSRPTSRSDSRKILQKKKPQPAPKEPQSSPRRSSTNPVPKEPAHRNSCGISPDDVSAPPPAAPALCYFDRITQRSIFDDPLDDFPALRRFLNPSSPI